MKKLIGNSMKLPAECQLRSRISELVLENAGRMSLSVSAYCPDCPCIGVGGGECVRRFSTAVASCAAARQDAEGGGGGGGDVETRVRCCLLQNTDPSPTIPIQQSPSSPPPPPLSPHHHHHGVSNPSQSITVGNISNHNLPAKNSSGCCIATKTRQCLLRLAASTTRPLPIPPPPPPSPSPRSPCHTPPHAHAQPHQTAQLHTVSRVAMAASPSPLLGIGSTTVPSLVNSSSLGPMLPCQRQFHQCRCLRMLQNSLPLAAMEGASAKGAEPSSSSFSFADEDEDEEEAEVPEVREEELDSEGGGEGGRREGGYGVKMEDDDGGDPLSVPLDVNQFVAAILPEAKVDATMENERERGEEGGGGKVRTAMADEDATKGSIRVVDGEESDARSSTSGRCSCWRCGAERSPTGSAKTPFFFCDSCSSIQPIDSTVNYFELLSIDKRFSLDVKQLESRYKGLQKKLHPDLFETRCETERAHSAGQAANVVKAYYTLLRPLSRAKYMLQLEGLREGEEEEGTTHDQNLLMDIMEFRERVDDATSDEGLLKTLAEENDQRMGEAVTAVAASLDAAEYLSAQQLIDRLTFYTRVAEEIQHRL